MAKVLSREQRRDRDAEFTREYVDNGGNATAAARAIGISEASASTVGHRLKTRLLNEIEEEQKDALKGYAVTAVHHLRYLAQSARSESVRLCAIKDILDRAGFKAVDRTQITYSSEFENWTDDQLRKEWERVRQMY